MPKKRVKTLFTLEVKKKYIAEEVLTELKALKYRFKPGPKDEHELVNFKKRDPGRVKC